MEDRANRPFLDRHYLAVGEMLNNLNLDPLVDLGMRLGEGTGAVYGLSIIGSAAAVSTRMLTFKEAAVSGPGEHR